LLRRKTYDISSSTASDYHEMLVTALQAGDRTRAERVMSEHISGVRKKLVDFLVRQENVGHENEVASTNGRQFPMRVLQKA
jgi:DNA-binding GntR family transcriptional regulator